MVNNFRGILTGVVQITISKGHPERFFNLCKSRQICLKKIRCIGQDTYTAFLLPEDFFRLRPIRNKSRVHIRVIKKRGLPFFFCRNRKRKAFFLGIIICFITMIVLSKHIWNIDVKGNCRNSTTEILIFLNQNGIKNGMTKSNINCEKIASMIREKYSDIAWVSAQIQGTNLLLTVQEALPEHKITDTDTPCNLSAQRDGRIIKMITRRGIPVVHPGDSCKKGDILVSGELPVMNDDQEVVRYAYVKADADIWVSYRQKYHHAFPLKYKVSKPTGQTRYGFSVTAFKKYLELYPAMGKYWKIFEEYYPLRITSSFCLPIIFRRAVFKEFTLHNDTYSEENAKTLATKQLQQYEKELLDQGIQIIKNNVRIRVTETECIADGTLTLLEKNCAETPVVPETHMVQ